MLRNCFVFLGVVFLVLIFILILVAVVIFFDVPLPSFGEATPTVQVVGTPGGEPQITRVNPLPPLPTETPTPTIAPPTNTPDPVAWRTETLLRVRNFSTALEAFVNANQRLQQNQELLNDPTWRGELEATLNQLVATAEAMALQPVPPEYQAIYDALAQVGPQAQALRENYLQGLQTGEQDPFNQVGENMNRIVEAMIQAENAMIAAGWNP